MPPRRRATAVLLTLAVIAAGFAFAHWIAPWLALRLDLEPIAP